MREDGAGCAGEYCGRKMAGKAEKKIEQLLSALKRSTYFRLAGGMIPFMRKYTTIWP